MAQLALDRSFRIAQHRSSYPADWYIEDDEPVAQSIEHAKQEDRLTGMLRAWKARTDKDVLVGRELAFRWDPQHPKVGVDPDVFVVEMPPLEADGNLRSIRTWEKGHMAPLLAIEIASRCRPEKDYVRSPERHDLLGTYELWVFDPHLNGHSQEQASVRLQLFQRETNNHLVRVYAGSGPMFSEVLQAWVLVVDDDLVISNDQAGTARWPTLEEEATLRADAEAKRADAERLAKEQAFARIAELEAMLAKRR